MKMGAMNKHPSCQATWLVTTNATRCVSSSFADLMLANTFLEQALIAEMEGGCDKDAVTNMIRSAVKSRDTIREASDLLVEAIQLGEQTGTPYVEQFSSLVPHKLGLLWNTSIVPGQMETVVEVSAEIKGDHLAPSRRFVSDLRRLEELTDSVVVAFESLVTFAHDGNLRRALEENRVPIQADFALLLTKWMKFLGEYVIDSLVATHVAFEAKGHQALEAS